MVTRAEIAEWFSKPPRKWLDRPSVWYVVDDAGCWIWQRALNDMGYGQIRRHHRVYYAHRLFYIMIMGEIPDGLELDHRCRMPACVNPFHLELVTHLENINRAVGNPLIENGKKERCHRGHPFDVANTYYRKDRTGRGCRQCARDRRSVSASSSCT